MQIPFFDLKRQYQSLKPEIEPEVCRVLESCAYIGGDSVKGFETEFADYLGVKHAVGCSDGTSALVLALRACGVEPGDEVITTAFSFFATAESIASVGAVPVFVDVRPEDYLIDPEKIEPAVTEKTKAILPVHLFGAMCDMDRITDIARRCRLRVIEDAAQAAGSERKGQKAGAAGDVGCFSFYPTKNLGGCGDGGMCTTGDERLHTTLLALREHGAGSSGALAREYLTGLRETPETGEKAAAYYDPQKYYNYLIGYNSRLDAIQARILSVKLRHLKEYNHRRAAIAKAYSEGLTDRVIRPDYTGDGTPCWHQYVIRTEKKQELCRYLSENGIGSGTFYPIPLHRQKAFTDRNSRVSGGCPAAEALSRETVCLPIFPELSQEEIRFVIDTVNRFFEEGTE